MSLKLYLQLLYLAISVLCTSTCPNTRSSIPALPSDLTRRTVYKGTATAAAWCFSAAMSAPRAGRAEDSEVWYNPRNERIYDTRRRSYLPTVSASALIEDELNKRNQRVVVIGEIHSNPCHHRVEFDVVKAFFKSNTEMMTAVSRKPFTYAIGMECFYRQHQAALDRYVFEHRDFKTLKEETNWSRSWGYDLNYYAKILNFACQNKIRLLGLNIPYPVAKYIGSVGLVS